MKFKLIHRKSDDAPRWIASDSKNLFSADGNLSKEEVATAVQKGLFRYDGLDNADGLKVLIYQPNVETFEVDDSKGITVIDGGAKVDYKIKFVKE